MQAPKFEENLLILMNLAQEEMVALICAEAVPWHCYRSLIADALTIRGRQVVAAFFSRLNGVQMVGGSNPLNRLRIGNKVVKPPEWLKTHKGITRISQIMASPI